MNINKGMTSRVSQFSVLITMSWGKILQSNLMMHWYFHFSSLQSNKKGETDTSKKLTISKKQHMI